MNHSEERYIQSGFTALRDPATRDFLPAVPLYIKAEDGAEEAEQRLINDIGHLLALRMKDYMDGCKGLSESMEVENSTFQNPPPNPPPGRKNMYKMKTEETEENDK